MEHKIRIYLTIYNKSEWRIVLLILYYSFTSDVLAVCPGAPCPTFSSSKTREKNSFINQQIISLKLHMLHLKAKNSRTDHQQHLYWWFLAMYTAHTVHKLISTAAIPSISALVKSTADWVSIGSNHSVSPVLNPSARA